MSPGPPAHPRRPAFGGSLSQPPLKGEVSPQVTEGFPLKPPLGDQGEVAAVRQSEGIRTNGFKKGRYLYRPSCQMI